MKPAFQKIPKVSFKKGAPIVLLAALAVVMLFAGMRFFAKSNEMTQLLKLEKTLSLADYQTRRIDDRGCYKDHKGAKHCVRSISFIFDENLKNWPEIESKLSSSGWEFMQNTSSSRNRIGWNGSIDNPNCISYKGVGDGLDFASLSLSGTPDSSCEHIVHEFTRP